MRTTILILLLALGASFASPAAAQSVEERLRQLEARVLELERRASVGGNASASNPRPSSASPGSGTSVGRGDGGGVVSVDASVRCGSTCHDFMAQDACRTLGYRRGVAGRTEERGGTLHMVSVTCSQPEGQASGIVLAPVSLDSSVRCGTACHDFMAQDACRTLGYRRGLPGRTEERGGTLYMVSITCAQPDGQGNGSALAAISVDATVRCGTTCHDFMAQDACRNLGYRRGLPGRTEERGGTLFMVSVTCSGPQR